jgi:hypothetical protein
LISSLQAERGNFGPLWQSGGKETRGSRAPHPRFQARLIIDDGESAISCAHGQNLIGCIPSSRNSLSFPNSVGYGIQRSLQMQAELGVLIRE